MSARFHDQDSMPALCEPVRFGAHSPRAARPAPRRRGRPPLLTPDEALAQIRDVASAGRLFRVHIDNPALYARARRLWGSWVGALLAAGLDYDTVMADARRRSVETRRRLRGPRAAY